jgi:hypothetical protein
MSNAKVLFFLASGFVIGFLTAVLFGMFILLMLGEIHIKLLS